MNAPTSTPPSAEAERVSQPAPRRRRRERLRLPLMVGVPVVAAVVGVVAWLHGGRVVSTDDAYVQAARVAVSSDAAGRVVEVDVRDNQRVRAGQVLFKLDDRRFRIAVAAAEARLAAVRLRIRAEEAVYRQRQADLKAAEDTLDYQTREFQRQRRLLAPGIASRAQYDSAAHALDAARQHLAATRQQIVGTLAELGGQPDMPLDSHPAVQQAEAALAKARLELSYAVTVAPEDGVVTKVDQLQVGDYVNAAQPLFALVSSAHPWIEANFKETELTHMRPGQTAEVWVDTFPDRPVAAHVASLSPGTGSAFSLLPPENATGNWVKVVQRLPVRLTLDRLPPGVTLRAGMSADVDVDTGHRRRLADLFGFAGGR